jgi:hypothetical protein
MEEQATPRRWTAAMAIFGIVDWLVRLTVPVTVANAYGWLAGIATGVGLVATSEVSWRMLTGEWRNLWPSRMVLAYRRRPDDLLPDRPKGIESD